MLCPKCRRTIAEGFKFCPECGSSVSDASGQSAVERGGSIGGRESLRPDAGRAALPPIVSVGQASTRMGAPDNLGSAAPAVGGLIGGRYEVLEEIGRGGFAVVYRARDRKLNRIVAVKRLLPDTTGGSLARRETLERFRREAEAIAALNHRNIVSVYDHDEDGDGQYIVMEYMGGGNLRALLKARGGKLPVPEAVALIRGVAQGLAYAHRKNLVHRDIKPENVLLAREPGSEEPIPKIVDFGLARTGADSDLSRSGYGMGTPFYTPPEQRRDAKTVNHTADLYALGKTLYELLTGETPEAVDPEAIPPLPGLARVIMRCLKPHPEDRYFSVDEFLAALNEAVGMAAPVGGAGGLADGAARNACPGCGAANAPDVKFCEHCGAGLTRVCPECGRENSVHKKFCGACGTDVEGFLALRDTLARMEGFVRDKAWSRVVKEYGLARRDAKLTGSKGQAVRAGIEKAKTQADGMLAERDRLRESLSKLTGDDGLEEALRHAERIVEIDPHDAAMREQPDRLRARIEERDFLRMQKRVSAYEAEGYYAMAAEACEAFLKGHPTGPRADTVRRYVERFRELATREAKASVAAAERHREEAARYFSDRRFAEAAAEWELAQQCDPTNRESEQGIARSKTALRELALCVAKARQHLENGAPGMALTAAREAFKIRPGDPEALALANQAERLLRHARLVRLGGVAAILAVLAGAWFTARGMLVASNRDRWERAQAAAERGDRVTAHQLAGRCKSSVLLGVQAPRIPREWVQPWPARLGAAAADLTALTAHDNAVQVEGPAATAPANLMERTGSWAGDLMSVDLGNGVKMELVWIPAGEFDMGSNDGPKDEKPVHRVRIGKGFWMGKYEVTNGQYKRFLADSGYDGSGEADGRYQKHFRGNSDQPTGADHPMIWVSWNNAQAFCRWLSQKVNGTVRLPTEAEWEYACRAGGTSRFHSGNADSDLDGIAWHGGNSGGKTHPVGQKQANAWGLHDMSGNVWEWCQDWYGAYPSGEMTDPTGASSGSVRVLRGGSGCNFPVDCRSARRNLTDPTFTGNDYGFRVVGVR